MAVDRIKHTKPASQRTFLDELEPIPYEITEEELASMDPKMKKVLFGIEEKEEPIEEETGEAPADEKVETTDAEQDAEAVTAEPRPEPEEVFDPATAADFPPREGHAITVIFPRLEGFEEAENAVRAAAEHRVTEAAGRLWFAARYGAPEAAGLKQLNELLGGREDVTVLVDGKHPPFGRTLWLPLMYIFTTNSGV